MVMMPVLLTEAPRDQRKPSVMVLRAPHLGSTVIKGILEKSGNFSSSSQLSVFFLWEWTGSLICRAARHCAFQSHSINSLYLSSARGSSISH